MKPFNTATVAVGMALAVGATVLLPAEFYSGRLWFGFWCVVALVLVATMIRHRLWQRPAIFGLHISFLFMLAGGGATALWADRGYVTLASGTHADYYVRNDQSMHPLPIGITLEEFRSDFYEGTNDPRDYHAIITDDNGVRHDISMNRPARIAGWRFYQSSFTAGGGCILLASYDQAGVALSYAGYLLFALCGAIAVRRQRGLRYAAASLIIVVPIIFICAAKRHLQPVLATPWLHIHLSLIIGAYTLFLCTVILSILALTRHKKTPAIHKLCLTVILTGEYLLGLGIFAGAMWANVSWGRYWAWDPKETWALVTLIIYAVPLHKACGLRESRRALSIYLLAAPAAILFTFFGVNLLPSLHAYL